MKLAVFGGRASAYQDIADSPRAATGPPTTDHTGSTPSPTTVRLLSVLRLRTVEGNRILTTSSSEPGRLLSRPSRRGVRREGCRCQWRVFRLRTPSRAVSRQIE